MESCLRYQVVVVGAVGSFWLSIVSPCAGFTTATTLCSLLSFPTVLSSSVVVLGQQGNSKGEERQ